jgi:hypothetical protein
MPNDRQNNKNLDCEMWDDNNNDEVAISFFNLLFRRPSELFNLKSIFQIDFEKRVPNFLNL